MKRILFSLALWCATTLSAFAQLSPFPNSLPPNSVVGRTGISAGPAQAIPFSILTQGLVGSGSGIFGLTLRGDSDYTLLTTDRTVLTNAALTAPRTFTLMAASTLATGQQICIGDAFGVSGYTGAVTSMNTTTTTLVVNFASPASFFWAYNCVGS
jgi:hypothetical protein